MSDQRNDSILNFWGMTVYVSEILLEQMFFISAGLILRLIALRATESQYRVC
mgnify:CR=1 FL=1